MALRELTEPASLTLPNGRLNRDAVGWARRPLLNTDGIGRDGRRFFGRNKRWEYWCITTPTHIMALTVSSVDYAAVHEMWVFERDSGRSRDTAVTLIPARGVRLPGTMARGPARGRARSLQILIDETPTGTRLRAESAGASFDVVAELPDDHERLAVVVPWSDTRFQYTVKDVARPARGSVTVDGRTSDVPAGESWAVLDHGRGRWPYDIRWNWGAGSGRTDSHVIGIQLGGQWTDGTGSTENAILIDDRLHYIDEPVDWDFDRTAWRRPWRITGGGLDATFEPFHDKVSRTNLLVLSSSTDQYFGHWSGTFAAADREPVSFSGILGWVEDVHNRW
ncbi:DUF2804 domain-containing protein [Microlunatus elymi]|uniref:DUF2804 domain-containing protein n=1 Tax=Microlunatus elymi TaxID=2596828 RepID=A0A516Q2W4_9ACTN|nr:DUF2804 domain-containing protein [Microlunatus elymi]QDP97775.1 DUF2804 domain-containing protein [Microlunatus elymi]